MNIAFLTPAFNVRQKEANVITITSLAEALQKRGYRVILISNREKTLPFHETLPNGLEIYRPYKFFDLPIGRGYNPLHFFDLILAHALGVRWVEKKVGIKFDILQSFSAAPILMLRSILGRSFLKRQVKIVHNFKSISQYTLGKFLFTSLCHYFDRIIVQTEQQKNEMIKKGIKEKLIQVIPSHIDLNKFKPLNKQELKFKYGYQNQVVILYYGHFLSEKGVEYLVKAIPLLSEAILDKIKVLLVWSGLGNKHRYDGLIFKNKLQDKVEIIEKKVNIVEYINLADLVVLPYPHLKSTEANPSCILECMACRTLVITSDLPELTSFLRKNQEVIMFEPRNIVDLSQKIVKVINNQYPIDEILNNAYNKSRTFDLEKVVNQYIGLYQSLF